VVRTVTAAITADSFTLIISGSHVSRWRAFAAPIRNVSPRSKGDGAIYLLPAMCPPPGWPPRKRRARRKAVGVRVPILLEARPNARWSLDFVYDQFAYGRRFRVPNIVDDVTKECLGAIPDTSISGRRVARELTAIVERRGKSGSIVSDNGTEFTCNAMLA
jgi:transposase InsO family protein